MRARALVPGVLGAFLALMASGGSAYAEPPKASVASPGLAPAVAGEALKVTPRFDDTWVRVIKDAFDDWKLLVGRASLMVPPAASGLPSRQLTLPEPPAAPSPALSNADVEVGPVKIEPPTQSGYDARGQSGLLLGFQLRLPWMTP